MKKYLTPQRKKELSYQKDIRINGGESPVAFRVNWPRKKRKASRASRAAERALVTKLNLAHEADVLAEGKEKLKRLPKIHKWGVFRLGEYTKKSLYCRKNKQHRCSSDYHWVEGRYS